MIAILQTQTAVDLSNVLEESAFFLSEDMIKSGSDDFSDSSKNTLTWSQPYATLAIRIEQVFAASKSDAASGELKKVTFRSNDGNIIIVEDQSLMDALGVHSGENMAIVHLTMKNIGKKIVDSQGIGAPPYLINSQVVSISARRMLTSGEWDLVSGSLNVSHPVELQLHHNYHSYTNHVCAFWNHNLR